MLHIMRVGEIPQEGFGLNTKHSWIVLWLYCSCFEAILTDCNKKDIYRSSTVNPRDGLLMKGEHLEITSAPQVMAWFVWPMKRSNNSLWYLFPSLSDCLQLLNTRNCRKMEVLGQPSTLPPF